MFSSKSKKSFKLISNLLDEAEYLEISKPRSKLSSEAKEANEGDRADTDTRFHKSRFHAKTEFSHFLIARIFKKSEFANVLKQSTEEGLRNL